MTYHWLIIFLALIFEEDGKPSYVILAVCGFSKYVEGDTLEKTDAL